MTTNSDSLINIVIALDILCQGALASLLPDALDGWDSISSEIAIKVRSREVRDKVSSLDWYDLLFQELSARGVDTEEKLPPLLEKLRKSQRTRLGEKAVDFLITLIGDLIIAHQSGAKIAPQAIHFSTAHFATGL